MSRYNLTVQAPPGSVFVHPEQMKKVGLKISPVGGLVEEKDGMPIQNEDGTWQIRVLSDHALPLVKDKLEGFGLTVTREMRLN